MGKELLVEEIDAGKEFVRSFNDYAPVSVYFWLNPAETDQWYLYIASDDIDDTNFDLGYGEVLRRLGDANQWLDLFKIKLVNTADPIATDAIRIRDRNPNKVFQTVYRGSLLGGVGIDSAVIYPRLANANAVS